METNRTNKTDNKKRTVSIGIVFVILCIIGIFTLLQMSFNATKSILANLDTKHKYEEKLFPIVMFDPPTFENPATLREVDLMTYCVWATILGKNRDKYSYDDNMFIVVPASDVDMTAHTLFGSTISLSHKTFNDFENSYEYDENTKSYHVPMIALTAFYVPRVEDMVKSGDKLFLKVGYIPPKTIMNVNFTGKEDSEQEAAKYMIYEMRKNKNNYYLYAIRDASGVGDNMGSGLKPSYDNVMDSIKNQLDSNTVPKNEDDYLLPDTVPEIPSKDKTHGSQGEKGITEFYSIPAPPKENTTING